MSIKKEEEFSTSKPFSNRIKPFISYYYFHSSKDVNNNKNFVFYPNYKHALTVYKNSEVTIIHNDCFVIPSQDVTSKPIYCINKDKGIKVNIKGAFDKVGIVFNPLGINHFIEKPLHDVFKDTLAEFYHFGERFDSVLHDVFLEQNIENRIKLLDDFFETSLLDFDELILKKAIHELLMSNGESNVSDIAKKLNINRKTLLRLFKKHTNMSVEEYRKMVMFRQAFNFSQQHKESINLTDIAMFSMYYDQAHYIKHFKSITKETPKSLLYKVSHLGQEDTYWNLEK